MADTELKTVYFPEIDSTLLTEEDSRINGTTDIIPGTIPTSAFENLPGRNTRFGEFALTHLTPETPSTLFGVDNSGFGYQALHTLTTGKENTAIGSTALYSTTSGVSNVAIGKGALYSLQT